MEKEIEKLNWLLSQTSWMVGKELATLRGAPIPMIDGKPTQPQVTYRGEGYYHNEQRMARELALK